jgi:hypothetical protein
MSQAQKLTYPLASSFFRIPDSSFTLALTAGVRGAEKEAEGNSGSFLLTGLLPVFLCQELPRRKALHPLPTQPSGEEGKRCSLKKLLTVQGPLGGGLLCSSSCRSCFPAVSGMGMLSVFIRVSVSKLREVTSCCELFLPLDFLTSRSFFPI